MLGTADIARRRFLPALRQSKHSYLATLGSRSPERATAVVAQHGAGRAVGSYEAVLADPAVDLVYVPLPGPLHHQWVLKALAANKDVLCEKALVRSVAEVRELDAAARTAGRVVMEGFMYRFHPQWDPAVLPPLLAEVGEVTSAHCWTSFPYDPARDRWQDARMRGGALWEVGCYCLDALAWQFGEVAEVNVLTSARPGQDLTAVALRFASGMPATAWWSFSAAWSKRFLVVGTTGTLELEHPFPADGPGCIWIERRRQRRKVDLPGADCFAREIDHFTQAADGQVHHRAGRGGGLDQRDAELAGRGDLLRGGQLRPGVVVDPCRAAPQQPPEPGRQPDAQDPQPQSQPPPEPCPPIPHRPLQVVVA